MLLSKLKLMDMIISLKVYLPYKHYKKDIKGSFTLKKIICMMLTTAILSSFSVTSSMAASNIVRNKDNYKLIVKAPNEGAIMELYDKRQELFFQESVDIAKLNEIDAKLKSLGVDFLTLEEVEENFPEIKTQGYALINEKNKNKKSAIEDIGVAITKPTSKVNSWSTYRESNKYYQGQYYNIQRLIAQPTSEDSGLWEEGARSVNYSVNWTGGVTNFLSSVAWTAVGSVYTIPVTVYDCLSSVWDGLKPVTEIDPAKVQYQWETQTTAVFNYVRLENHSDDYQKLSHISTKCITAVAYIADVDYWKPNGTGEWIAYPFLVADSRNLYHTAKYYCDNSRALWAYKNSATPVQDCIDHITISGPESKTIQNIYPCFPLFPLHCE